MLEKYNPNKEYARYDGGDKCGGFSYLQYLVVYYHEIDNCLYVMQKDIDNSEDGYIDHKNDQGDTALMLSSARSHDSSYIDVVKLLIKNNANINLKNNSGYTALIFSAFTYKINYSLENIKIFIENIKILIENGANINLINDHGQGILLYCVFMQIEFNKIDLIKYLIKKGANLNSVDRYGTSLLMHCFANLEKFDSLEIVKYLIKNGADINLKDNSGNNPLDIGLKNNVKCSLMYEIIKYTIEIGIYVDYDVMKKVDDNDILQLWVDKIDFNDIEKVKNILLLINCNNNKLIIIFLEKLLKFSNVYTELEKLYIYSNISKEVYDNIIELNSKNMLKRVN